jgi:hypothetical protein
MVTRSNESSAPRRLYAIQYIDYEQFCAGLTSDDRQVLIGLLYPEIVAVFFDAKGEFIGVERRPLTNAREQGRPNPYDPDLHPVVMHSLSVWQMEMGFRPGTIEVRRFETYGAAIADRPWHYEEFLRNPAAFEPDEREQAAWRDEVRSWDQRGLFVLHWGKDYWMNADGSIDST